MFTVAWRSLEGVLRHIQGVFQVRSACNPIFKADRIFVLIKREFFPERHTPGVAPPGRCRLESVSLDPADVLGEYRTS